MYQALFTPQANCEEQDRFCLEGRPFQQERWLETKQIDKIITGCKKCDK